MFAKSQVVDNCFMAALQAANLMANPIGGRLILFQVAQTIIKHPLLAPKAGNSADRTDLVNATNPYFANTASELAHSQITCDLFIFSHGGSRNQQGGAYKNLANLADLAKFSSGSLYYYPEYSARGHGMKFSNELYHCLTRRVAWEAVFRIRTSTGFSQIASYGNIQIKNKTNDLILYPSVDLDRVVTYELEKTDSNLAGQGEDPNRAARRDTSHLYIQSALLYSTSEGERRIRVHNIAVPLTNLKHLPYEHMDVTALVHYWSRIALRRQSTNLNFQVCRSTIEMYLTNLCRAFLKAQSTNLTKPQLPDQFQYLAMYVLGLLKLPVMSPYDPKSQKAMVTLEALDPMTFVRYSMNHMSPEEVLLMVNPWVMNIHDYNLSDQEVPGLEALDRSVL
jgi:protein transport protein SEC24